MNMRTRKKRSKIWTTDWKRVQSYQTYGGNFNRRLFQWTCLWHNSLWVFTYTTVWIMKPYKKVKCFNNLFNCVKNVLTKSPDHHSQRLKIQMW